MSAPSAPQDLLRLQRASLQPLLQRAHFELPLALIRSGGESRLLQFLQQQGLAPLWSQTLEGQPNPGFSDQFLTGLHQARLQATGNYLLQRHRLQDVRSILDAEDIAHVTYKGAAFREQYYAEPALRPAVDIDVLVNEKNRERAISAFHKAGYSFYGSAKDIDHEASLTRGKCSIDLHWDILRPGRTRQAMAQSLVATRRDSESHWAMSAEASLFLMLVHPVFVRYTTTPQASLIRVVDLTKLLAKKSLVWKQTFALLEQAGLKTAAWITLRWLQLLTDGNEEKARMKQLAPGKLRQKYLNWWLEKNLATRLLKWPNLVQVGFTLAAHDKPGDALRAISVKQKKKRIAADDLAGIQEQISALGR